MKRGIYAAIIVSIVGAGAWLLRRAEDKKADQEISSTTLPTNDAARINIDPRRGTVTVIDRGDVRNDGGTKQHLQGSVRETYIGTHPARIDIDKAGKVSVTVRKFGTEVAPFVGLALGTDIAPRAAVGLNLFYIQRWEVGGGLLLDSNIKDTRMFAHVAYNVYDGIDLSIGVDNRHTAHLLASLKF